MLKVLEILQDEIGYLEKASARDLDTKTGNVGTANFTKYARDLDAVNYFNGKKQGAQWCTTLVNWPFFRAYGRDTALRVLRQPLKGSLGASCTYAVDYYRKAGAFFTSDPHVGDQIFFRSGASIVHTGIIEDIVDGCVITIEGNTSATTGVVSNGGGVWRKKYLKDYSRIYGFGRPDWSLVRTEAEEAVEWITGKGIMKGNASGDLMLDQPITRKQFAVMLYRYDQQRK